MEAQKALLHSFSERATAAIPDIVLAVVILMIGVSTAYLLRKTSFWVVRRLPQLYGGIFADFFDSSQLQSLATFVSRIIFWMTFLIGISLILQVFGVNLVQEWARLFARYLPNLLGAFIILVSGFLVANFLRDFLRRTSLGKAMGKRKNIPTFTYLMVNGITLLIAVKQLGIDIEFVTSTLLTVIGCALLGGAISFGIGSSGVVANILSLHYIKKGLRIGTQVRGDQFHGQIMKFTATSVFIKTDDGILVIPARVFNETPFRICHESND